MKKTLFRASLLSAGILCAFSQSALAKVSPEEAARLGKDLTCSGAEKAGNADGSIPEFSGKWLGAPDHIKHEGTGKFWENPYAGEKPLFTITAQNMDQYADKLSDGLKALFKKYPDTFKMPVYTSHRDFRFPDWVCDAFKKNATTAELVDDGLGLKAVTGSHPFPIPKTGLELLWNINNTGPQPHKTELTTQDVVVYPDGNLAWGKTENKFLGVRSEPGAMRDTTDFTPPYGGIQSLTIQKTHLPLRDKGTVYATRETFNYKTLPRDVYLYNPGTRRVRQAPSFGFDMPQGAGGFRTVDEHHMFNGSPERYDWKIVGKREMYIPWNAFGTNQADVKIADLIKHKGHVNTDPMRFELQRVWVLEATLKPGFRHQYAKRVFYIQEDTWGSALSDQYDGRGQLWRTVLGNWMWAYESQTPYWGIAAHHDLISGAYLVDNIANETGAPVLETKENWTPAMFSAEAAARWGR
ncbi:Protein of unknown function [Geopseudomonas sagittaria]|uniref:DUF1329 domain-containing protein n=1 Tax=Geopseudomonas sagittaria TaxID=1135990 RepID=A0A1I5QVG0_9GAMM|nr:DUF1329 domain-containing protein [Pseudomonas sagittaria]SFP50222.1 Protein of unknown function [Pseudomonas sagittaria]